jgi:hypothetical protein
LNRGKGRVELFSRLAPEWFDLRPETPRGVLNSNQDSSNAERCASTGYVERPVIEVIPWDGSSDLEPKAAAAPKELRDPLNLARSYQSLLDSGKFENRAALARFLGVSRARVTQALRRLR